MLKSKKGRKPMKSSKITMERFIATETEILAERDATIKALKEEEKRVYDESRKKVASLIEEAQECGLFKMRLGDYLKELERVTGVLPGTIAVHADMTEYIDGDIRRSAAAKAFDSDKELEKRKQLKIMLFCNHPGRGFVTSFTAPFTLLNNDFADGSRFRENLNIDVREEGGEVVSFVSMKEGNIRNLVADLSSIMEAGMMRECRDALVSSVKKKEKQNEEERTK